MKVILLTQYFPPETGAPQNRLYAIAQGLRKRGAEVTVLTAMPNYPDMRVHERYRGKWSMEEDMDGLRVIRAWLLVSAKRSILWRLMNYFSFVFSSLVIGLFKLKRSDVLFVESPPLFLGITAMLLARLKRAKLVFNVSDLWPESAVQLGLVTNPMLIRMSTWLEMKCYRRASLITAQTQGIVDDIKRRCPDQNVMWLPNGVDFDAIAAANDAPIMDPRSKLGIGVDDPVVAYAGIIGHAQGLDVVLNAAVLLRERTNIHFLLIGDGPEKAMLLEMKTKLDPINVRFIDRMPRAELLSLMRSIDAVVVPLRKNDLFKGAIPSKIFEALALGKPLLLGVEGEAKRLFVDDAGAGLAYDPENAHSLAGAVRRVCDDRATAHEMGARGREYVRAHFDRDVLTERLWVELQAMTTAGR